MEDNDAPPGSRACRRVLPPTSGDTPKTVTAWPRAAAIHAASRPAMPAPTTTTRRRRAARAGRQSSSSASATRGLLSHTSGWCSTICPQQVLQETQNRISDSRPAALLSGHAGSVTSGRPSAISSTAPRATWASASAGSVISPRPTSGTPLTAGRNRSMSPIHVERGQCMSGMCQSSVLPCVPWQKAT